MFGLEQLYIDNPLVFGILVFWSLAWKGVALWKAARNSQKNWFVALLVLNTVGILEIIYIYFFSKKGEKSTTPPDVVNKI